MAQSAAEANRLMEEQHGFNSSNGDPEEWTPTLNDDDDDDEGLDIYDDEDYCDECGDFLRDNGTCPSCEDADCCDGDYPLLDHSNGVGV